MPTIKFDLALVLQPLGDGTFLDEALLFPEICSFGNDPARLHRAVKNLLTRTLLDIPAVELHRRRLPGTAEAGVVDVTLDPPKHAAVWQQPVLLRLPVVRWSHPAPGPGGNDDALPAPEAALAFVPALGMEVLASRPDLLDAMLMNHIRTTLMRTRATTLEALVWLQRCREVEVVRLTCSVDVKSPTQLAQEQADHREQPPSVLSEVGVDLTREPLRTAYAMDVVVERLVETLTGAEPRSVLLVGPSGVGKTAAVHEMVRRRTSLNLGATPFWATSGARLVAGMSGFGMWQERAAKLWREVAHKRAILHLGNLLELMEVGKSEHQGQGIASFLRPALGRGDMLTIAECTPEQLPLIERQEPHLLSVFTQIPVAEPAREQGATILEQVARSFDASKPMPITLAGLAKLDQLHRRYATYSAYPGRPLRFLHNLLTDQETGRVASATDVTRGFARETGLPLCLLEESEPLDLVETRRGFAQRVIGQAEPVDLVADLLGTIKASLTRPHKPIASLLFIGPTGVGKTEMAKALAEFLFGSKQRLTRFDMSEYADPHAVGRLVGGSFQGEGHLTARIREQPFAVLLLDEIEKAHPSLFDLLLQVLGEGRLTDAAGRVADFCNCVVIMTSNLGAESFQKSSFGLVKEAMASDRSREHFLGAVQDFFRPELFNRIDRVVPFAPLDEATILGIAHRQLDLVRQRDGIRFRGVTVDVEPAVAAWLAQRGFDARYGARPLKRTIDRELLAPLAEQLNGYHADTPLRAQVAVEGDVLHAQVKAAADGAPKSPQADAEFVTACMDLRRDLQKLFRGSAALEMDNEIHRLQLLEERARKGKHLSPDDARRLARLATWRQIRTGLDELFAQACTLEDKALLALLGEAPTVHADLQKTWQAGREQWDRWLLALYLQRFDKPDDVIVAIFSEHPALLLTLGEAYHCIVLGSAGRAEVWQYLPSKQGRDKDEPPPLERRLILDPGLLWKQANSIPMRCWDHEKKVLRPEARIAKPLEGVIGLGLVLHAPAAFPRFHGEDGLHTFRTSGMSGHCLVDTSHLSLQEYRPPAGMDRRGSIGNQAGRRSYDLVRGVLEDPRLSGKLSANADNLAVVLASALEQWLKRNVEAILRG